MKSRKLIYVAALALFAAVPSALANTWYVDGMHGSDNNNCKSRQHACKTIFANGVLYTDSSDGTDNLLALDPATGRKLWGSPNFVALPVIANGVIYGFPKSGLLAALDARNGKLLNTVSTLGNITGIAVVDGNVYSAGYITTKLLIKYGLGK